MSIQTVSRKLHFDAGHRLMNHEGRCQYLHGHRYTATIFVRADKLDRIGRVVDFGIIKGVVGTWIDENWDHNLILNTQDLCISAVAPYCRNGQPYLLDHNPTAENMAAFLQRKAGQLLRHWKLTVPVVRIDETPNCSATYEEDV